MSKPAGVPPSRIRGDWHRIDECGVLFLPNAGGSITSPLRSIPFDLYNCLVLGIGVTDLSSPVLLTSTTQSSAVGLPGMTH